MRKSIHAQRLILLICLMLLAAGVPSSVGEAATFAAPASQAFSCATVSQIPQSECEALVAFYNSTNGPGWIPQTNWLTTNTPCAWHLVGCEDGHVSALYLTTIHLSGPLPPELGQLANLQSLVLGNNNLIGPLPPELGQLANLQWLTLADNQLNGLIPPELGNLANLQYLALTNNQLSGPLPSELGQLVHLQMLELNNNDLSGPLPPELGQLANLQMLDLANNQLSGPIPPELGQLANLQRLDLTGNRLSETIPPELGQQINLLGLYLSGNQLSGLIPPEFGQLTYLHRLYLANNQLSGPIPPELGQLAYLQRLDLANNRLSGLIPPELGQLADLQVLNLNGNQLSGLIPTQLANLTSLYYLRLDLDYNALTATDPALLAFLERKRPGWDTTQTVAPTSVQASAWVSDTIEVTWTPIRYTGDGGYYEISYATDPAGPFTVHGVTLDKSSNQYTLTELAPDTRYFVRVRTYTPAHDMNQNELWSDYSSVVFVNAIYLPLIAQ
jgi:Leucine-rich repeat (LRR) protein